MPSGHGDDSLINTLSRLQPTMTKNWPQCRYESWQVICSRHRWTNKKNSHYIKRHKGSGQNGLLKLEMICVLLPVSFICLPSSPVEVLSSTEQCEENINILSYEVHWNIFLIYIICFLSYDLAIKSDMHVPHPLCKK